MIKPTRRICHICGKEYWSRAPREFFCPACKPEAERMKRARNNAAKKIRVELAKQRSIVNSEKPGKTIWEMNREMREKGLTYGGKPIVSQNAGWPKFLREANKTWKRNCSD